jgi:hypothetical protein
MDAALAATMGRLQYPFDHRDAKQTHDARFEGIHNRPAPVNNVGLSKVQS